MSAAKHTPGPWWATDKGVRDSGGYIAFTRDVTHFPGQDKRYISEVAERAANRTLIAATTDMLAALTALEHAASFAGITDMAERRAVGEALRLAREAIAKATGADHAR